MTEIAEVLSVFPTWVYVVSGIAGGLVSLPMLSAARKGRKNVGSSGESRISLIFWAGTITIIASGTYGFWLMEFGFVLAFAISLVLAIVFQRGLLECLKSSKS